MGSAPIGIEGSGEGSFLWLAPFAPPKGWTAVPRGGMCLCAFLFVTTFFYEPAIAPGEKHFDVLFLFDVSVEAGGNARTSPWYEALEWIAIGSLRHEQFARQHEDVAEAWLKKRAQQHLPAGQ